MSGPRTDSPLAVTLLDGRVLVINGRDANGDFLKSTEIYDPAVNEWHTAGSTELSHAPHGTATVLRDGRVLVVGGHCGGECWPGFTASAEVFDPSTESWTTVGSLNGGWRIAHTATLLPDGRVLVAGGHEESAVSQEEPNYDGITTSAEIFDPATNTWSVTGAMTEPRSSHAATPVSRGRVLVSGGFCQTANNPRCDETPSGDQRNAEIYNLATGTWSKTASMRYGRSRHAQFRIANDKVVAVAGLHESGVSETEVYDVRTDTWSIGAPMLPNTYAHGHSSGMLRDGRFMLVSGGPAGGIAQVYDPDANVWLFAGKMSLDRVEGFGTPLRDGRFIAGGGVDGCFPDCGTSSTEVATPLAIGLR